MLIKKRKKKKGPVQIYRHKSSVNRLIYINKLKPKLRGRGRKINKINAQSPLWISIVPNVLSQRWYVCIITSGARHTESSSHPGASFLKDLQGQRRKKHRRSECAARRKPICKKQGHVESVTVSSSLAPPTGTRSSSQGRPCIYPTCRLNQTHWIESGEKGKCLHKAGERKALRQGVAGANNGWAHGAEPLVNLGAGVTRCCDHVHGSLGGGGGGSRADKEIAREEKGKILLWLWQQVLLWKMACIYPAARLLWALYAAESVFSLSHGDYYIIIVLRRERN